MVTVAASLVCRAMTATYLVCTTCGAATGTCMGSVGVMGDRANSQIVAAVSKAYGAVVAACMSYGMDTGAGASGAGVLKGRRKNPVPTTVAGAPGGGPPRGGRRTCGRWRHRSTRWRRRYSR